MIAADIMTRRVVTIHDDASLEEAARIMLDEDVSALPVVDRAGDLIGTVSEHDLLKSARYGCSTGAPRWLEYVINPWSLALDHPGKERRTVADVMVQKVISVDEDADLRDVVTLMESMRATQIVVMRNHKIIGVVCRGNLLQALLSEPPATCNCTDRAIREKIFDELNALPWVPSVSVNPVVREGVVELHGFVRHDQERVSLTDLIEDLAGVVAVRDHLVRVDSYSGKTPRVLIAC